VQNEKEWCSVHKNSLVTTFSKFGIDKIPNFDLETELMNHYDYYFLMFYFNHNPTHI